MNTPFPQETASKWSISNILKHPFYTIILLILTIGTVFVLSRSEKNITNSDSTGTTIVAFGDSLVQGIGTTPDKNFVSVLSRSTGQSIINLGRSGDTTAAALQRIDTVLAERPKLVFVLLGGNDYLRKVPVDDTFTNLSTIIQKIQAQGAAVIILGIRGGVISDQYKERFEQLADTYHTGYVPDVLDGLIGNTTLMSDPIHPNEKGYELIANKISPEFLEVLSIMNKDRK